MEPYLNPEGVCDSLDPENPLWTCAGCGLDGSTDSYNEWITLNCPLQFQQLSGRDIGSVIYDLTGEQTSKLYTNNLLDTYFVGGYDDPFEEVLHQFCNSPGINPGICQNYLAHIKCPQYDYDSITSEEARWCGCLVLPSDQDRSIYGDNIACYPLCHLSDTIQLVDSSGRLIQCDNQVCIIDDVTVNVVDSRVGDVSLTQICPGCSGNCSCIINDVNVTGADVNVDQYCGSDTQCWRTVDGELVQVSCQVTNIYDNWLFWLIIILTIIMIVVIIIIALYQAVRYNARNPEVVIQREIPIK